MEPRIFGLSLAWVPYAAGPVWMALTVLMGMAAWTLSRSGADAASTHALLVLGLIVLCWLHPFYTWWFERSGHGRQAAFAGGLLTLPVAAGVAIAVSSSSTDAALMLSAVVVWLAMANVYMGLRARTRGG